MPKTETKQKFDYLVSKVIWTHFKPLGYKKSGNNFRYYDDKDGFGKIINFQKSAYGDKENIRFTINIGLYLSDYEFYLCGKVSLEKFIESRCAVIRRIGVLMQTTDHWYELNAKTDEKELYATVESDFIKYVNRFLKVVNSREDTVRALFGDYYNHSFARIKTLYFNGYEDKAMSLLNEIYRRTNDKDFIKRLDDLRNELTEGRKYDG
jgi:hypothetical protein